MSAALWDGFPYRFLKMGYSGWRRLDTAVQRLVAESAERQHFKCALCTKTNGLIIEHDHFSEEGLGHPYTVLNIRGLVCTRCNWHLNLYEKKEAGEYFGWDHAYCRISSSRYEEYVWAYERRVSPLIEELREQRMGSANYWRRRLLLQRFDSWFYDGEYSAWRERWAKEEALRIRTPEKAIEVFVACANFVIAERERDPDFKPPEKFLEVAKIMFSIVDEAMQKRAGLQANALTA